MTYDEPTRSDRDAERAVLSACMVSKTGRNEARRHLVARDFDDEGHRTIWEAMTILDRTKKEVDHVTLLAALRSMEGGTYAIRKLTDVVTAIGIPDNVPHYAAIVRAWSIKRQFEFVGRQIVAEAANPSLDPGWADGVVSKLAGIRDASVAEDVTALTLRELLEQEDDEPEWLLPGLMERRDRLILTGEEGLGKSHLMRQFAVYGAAGLHPFNLDIKIPPIKAAIIDNENSPSQVRRRMRPMVDYARRYGHDPQDRVMVDCVGRMDITRDKDLAKIHQFLDAMQPDLVIIGPLYRLTPRALQTDDEASPVLAALDTIRERGCALLTEAHAGHAVGKSGQRDMRPRGSSALMGWPEFGYGLRNIGTEGYCDLVPWRGNREERDWPQRMRRGDGFRWTPHGEVGDAWKPGRAA